MARWRRKRPTNNGAPETPADDNIEVLISRVAEPWRSSFQRSIDEMNRADPLYRPTNFWQPGVAALFRDLHQLGLEKFKSWPSSGFFFYPRYSPVFTNAMVAEVLPHLRTAAPAIPDG